MGSFLFLFFFRRAENCLLLTGLLCVSHVCVAKASRPGGLYYCLLDSVGLANSISNLGCSIGKKHGNPLFTTLGLGNTKAEPLLSCWHLSEGWMSVVSYFAFVLIMKHSVWDVSFFQDSGFMSFPTEKLWQLPQLLYFSDHEAVIWVCCTSLFLPSFNISTKK